MGSNITDWAAVEGAYYTGVGSGESMWLWVSIVMCVVALISGAMHEKKAYSRLRK